MIDFDLNRMLFTLTPDEHDVETVRSRLVSHPEVKFVSFTGKDMGNHSTDEKIPVAVFLDDMEKMLEGSKNITYTQKNVKILCAMNDANKAQIKALAQELLAE